VRIGIAADHGGFELKERLGEWLAANGHEVVDFGPGAFEPDDDYPDYVVPLARAVAEDQVERGLAVCGSGVGAAVAANKVAGVRACLIVDAFSAHQGVEDDDMNLLCLGGRIVGLELARDLTAAFISATFTREARFRRRLKKIGDIEGRG